MSETDLRILSAIRNVYQKKMDRALPTINRDAISTWMRLFNTFWRYCDRRKLKGSSLQHKKVSAVILMRNKGLTVPDVIYEMMLIRDVELSSGEYTPILV